MASQPAPATTASAPPAPSPSPPAPQQAAKPADEKLTIAFAEGSTALSADADAAMDHAARLYRDATPEVMIVAGHSDATGTEYGNLVLSAQRAAAVKRGLVERGIPAERLQIIAIGAAQPAPDVTPTPSAVVTWR